MKILVKKDDIANTDELTGIKNKRALSNFIKTKFPEYQKNRTKLSGFMIDIDDFSQVNKNFPYGEANKVLFEFAQVLKDNVRAKPDLLLRLGGDEFLVLAPNTAGVGVKAFSERLRSSVENHKFQAGKNLEEVSLTFSSGASEFNYDNDTMDIFLNKLDSALKKAKEKKNRTVLL